MEWLSTAATIMVTMAIVLRLGWWAFERSHRLAVQRQGAVEGVKQSVPIGPNVGRNNKVSGGVESETPRK